MDAGVGEGGAQGFSPECGQSLELRARHSPVHSSSVPAQWFLARVHSREQAGWGAEGTPVPRGHADGAGRHTDQDAGRVQASPHRPPGRVGGFAGCVTQTARSALTRGMTGMPREEPHREKRGRSSQL